MLDLNSSRNIATKGIRSEISDQIDVTDDHLLAHFTCQSSRTFSNNRAAVIVLASSLSHRKVHRPEQLLSEISVKLSGPQQTSSNNNKQPEGQTIFIRAQFVKENDTQISELSHFNENIFPFHHTLDFTEVECGGAFGLDQIFSESTEFFIVDAILSDEYIEGICPSIDQLKCLHAIARRHFVPLFALILHSNGIDSVQICKKLKNEFCVSSQIPYIDENAINKTRKQIQTGIFVVEHIELSVVTPRNNETLNEAKLICTNDQEMSSLIAAELMRLKENSQQNSNFITRIFSVRNQSDCEQISVNTFDSFLPDNINKQRTSNEIANFLNPDGNGHVKSPLIHANSFVCFPLSAHSRDSLLSFCSNFGEKLKHFVKHASLDKHEEHVLLVLLAKISQTKKFHHRFRAFLIVSSLFELIQKLETSMLINCMEECPQRELTSQNLALFFPPQGVKYNGIHSAVSDESPLLRQFISVKISFYKTTLR